MKTKYLPAALILYMNYFIHGIGCSILGQQVIKEMLVSRWGLADVAIITAVSANLGLGRLISLPFAGPLSDKLGRRLSVIIGCASYALFFFGLAWAPSYGIGCIVAILGGLANSFLDTATYPAVAEIIDKYTGIATMGIKFFISISQMLMPFFLGLAVGSAFGYNGLLYAGGIAIAVLGVLCIFAPLPAASESGKKESLLQNIKNAHWTAESIALIAIGFTSTATFQLWLNCAQTFAKEIAGVPSEEAAIMQTYYSVGT